MRSFIDLGTRCDGDTVPWRYRHATWWTASSCTSFAWGIPLSDCLRDSYSFRHKRSKVACRAAPLCVKSGTFVRVVDIIPEVRHCAGKSLERIRYYSKGLTLCRQVAGEEY